MLSLRIYEAIYFLIPVHYLIIFFLSFPPNLTMAGIVLICSSVIMSETKQLFVWYLLAIHHSSYENCILISLFYLLVINLVYFKY